MRKEEIFDKVSLCKINIWTGSSDDIKAKTKQKRKKREKGNNNNKKITSINKQKHTNVLFAWIMNKLLSYMHVLMLFTCSYTVFGNTNFPLMPLRCK